MPTPSVRQGALLLIGGTVLAGQAAMLTELGAFSELAELYELAVWGLVGYVFWPQIRALFHIGLNAAMNRWGADAR